MTLTYTYTTGTRDDVRGCCGHQHRTIDGAIACIRRDDAACHRQGGYSDRVAIVRSDGARNTVIGVELGDEWEISR